MRNCRLHHYRRSFHRGHSRVLHQVLVVVRTTVSYNTVRLSYVHYAGSEEKKYRIGSSGNTYFLAVACRSQFDICGRVTFAVCHELSPSGDGQQSVEGRCNIFVKCGCRTSMTFSLLTSSAILYGWKNRRR